jgi:hypothetical protein
MFVLRIFGGSAGPESFAAKTAWDHERRELLHMHHDPVVCDEISPIAGCNQFCHPSAELCCHPAQRQAAAGAITKGAQAAINDLKTAWCS